jgi:glucose-1-phosphate thymidylyltransferase
VVRSTLVTGWWKDTGRKDDLLHANELVLADLTDRIEGDLVDCTVRGTLEVGAGSHLVDCTVTGPAIIGTGSHLARVTVGPNTAIGNDCRLSDATIEESIMLDESEVHGWKLRRSLLGRAVRLHGAAPAGSVETMLGEHSEMCGE